MTTAPVSKLQQVLSSGAFAVTAANFADILRSVNQRFEDLHYSR